MGLGRSIKRSFWRGVAALLPALLTVIVLVFGVSLVHNYAGQYVNRFIRYGVHLATGVPLADIEAWYAAYWLGWLGGVVAVVALCMAAYFVGTFLGVRLIRFVEASLMRLPLVRRIYPGAKQVSDFFFSERQLEFRRVVAVEFPQPGQWMVGFVTGRGFRALSDRLGTELLSVFVATSPTPVTGFIITVPKDKVIDLPISVDEAVQYIVSLGVIMPPAERLESLEAAMLIDKEELAKVAARQAQANEKGRTPDRTDKPSPPGQD